MLPSRLYSSIELRGKRKKKRVGARDHLGTRREGSASASIPNFHRQYSIRTSYLPSQVDCVRKRRDSGRNLPPKKSFSKFRNMSPSIIPVRSAVRILREVHRYVVFVSLSRRREPPGAYPTHLVGWIRTASGKFGSLGVRLFAAWSPEAGLEPDEYTERSDVGRRNWVRCTLVDAAVRLHQVGADVEARC